MSLPSTRTGCVHCGQPITDTAPGGTAPEGPVHITCPVDPEASTPELTVRELSDLIAGNPGAFRV